MAIVNRVTSRIVSRVVSRITPPPPPFAPTDIPDLTFQHDASLLTPGPLQTWPDLINNFNFTQATSVDRPIVVSGAVNGKNAVLFDNATTYMEQPFNATLSPVNNFTRIIVAAVNVADDATFHTTISDRSPGANTKGSVMYFNYSVSNKSELYFGDNDASWQITDGNAITINQPEMLTFKVDSSNNGEFIQNGVSKGVKTNFSNNLTERVTIGATDIAVNFPLGGYICEILQYNKALSLQELSQLYNSYIKPKWGTP